MIVEQPLLSILVPVYNVQDYLERCLRSILSQTFTDFEIIVVNDCSPDNSQKIIDDFALRDTRVKPVMNKVNKGLGGARNVGMKHCRGEFVLFIDSDDFISDENAIEKLCAQAETHNLDVLDARYRILKADEAESIMPKKFKELNDRIYKGRAYMQAVEILPIVAWNKLYKLSFLRKHNILFKERKYEDICFTLEALFRAERVQNASLVFYNYIIRPGSIMTSKPTKSSIEDSWSLCMDLEDMYNIFDGEAQIEKSFFYSFVGFQQLLSAYDNKSHRRKIKKKLSKLHHKYRMNILGAEKLGFIQRISLFLNPKLTFYLTQISKTISAKLN